KKLDWHSCIGGFKSYLKLERSLSKNTIEAYLQDVDKLHQFTETAEGLAPDQLTTTDLRDFLKWVNELGMLPATQARVLSGLKAFFNYLALENIIQHNPAALLESPKLSRKLPDTLSVYDINLLIDA